MTARLRRERMREVLKKAFRATLPVLAGYLVLGAAFGVLMSGAGYKPWFTCLMSLTAYAGSLQFAAVSLLTGGASLISAGVTALSVNARHIFYGISMAERYALAGKTKPYLIFALTDETYSLVSAAHPDLSPEEELKFCFRVSLLDHLYWIAGTAIGAVSGSLLSIDTTGFEFALTALFLTVVIDQWRDTPKEHGSSLAGIGITLVCLLLFGRENFLLIAMPLIIVCLLIKDRGGKKA